MNPRVYAELVEDVERKRKYVQELEDDLFEEQGNLYRLEAALKQADDMRNAQQQPAGRSEES